VVAALVGLSLATPAWAQRAPAASGTLLAGVPDSALLADLQFRAIGPAVMSGRISDIAVPSATRPGERLGKTIYVASAAGGVWKTTNGGVTWNPLFDGQRVSSIGAVAVAPSNASIVYVGTGESNNLRSSSWGEGIYKSTDAGKTWSFSGLRTSQHIARIIVHPTNPDIVYVAAMGPLWGSGGERGLYKSTDGGRTWSNTKALGQFTGFTDVAFDPTNPNTLYAVSYQRERKAYSFVGGGPESGIWKSTDAGASWTQLTQGLPTGDKGRMGVSVSRSNPNTLYATVDASDGGIFRSDDAGQSWRRTNELQSIPWFFGQVRVDPSNPERVYHLGQGLSVSDDGGRTFRRIAGNTHADHHAMWIDPNDSDHLMIGNDGGFYISHERGADSSWDFAANLPVSTFYAIGVDMREPYWVYGGLQDNGSWGAPVTTRDRNGIGNEEWVRAGGGDGFYAAVDPQDHNVVYVESQNGALTRFDFATRESKSVRPQVAAGESPVRYNWSAPLLISPHDHRTLYFGANLLLRSTNRGDSWERVSQDLTRALDRNTLPIMGLSASGGYRRHEGTADYGNLATIDESPMRRGVLYTGSDDGVIGISRDGGAAWTKVDKFTGVPDMTYVSRVIASRHNEGTAYATFDGHRSNDFKPYVLKTTDFGRTWTSITGNLPDGSVYVIREHHRDPNLLVVGAEYGVFVTVNGGRSWAQLKNGIKPAPVHDLVIHPRDNDIIVGTHGRGIFVLDDISALEKLAASGTRIAGPRPATIFNTGAGYDLPGDRSFSEPNPRAGAAVTYLVAPNTNAAAATLSIADAQGKVVRELSAPSAPGIHRVYWDLRHAAASAQPAATPRPPADEEEQQGPPQAGGGPYVSPGTYLVQLKARGGVLAQSNFEVRRDPQVRLADAEWRDLYTERARAYDLQVRANRLASQLDDAKRRIVAFVQGKDASAPNVQQVRQLEAQVDSALQRVRGGQGGGRGGRGGGGGGGGGGRGGAGAGLVGRVNSVASEIGTNHFVPTPQHKRTLTESETALQREQTQVDALLVRVTEALRVAS
jgi:photosystem II stability/assembly factor-like uncharacterized protein